MMMLLLSWSCTYEVDFGNDTGSAVAAPTEDDGTSCSGFGAGSPPRLSLDEEFQFVPVPQLELSLDPVDFSSLHFDLHGGAVDVRVGTQPRAVFSYQLPDEGAPVDGLDIVASSSIQNDTWNLVSRCSGERCREGTYVFRIPQPISHIAGFTGSGDVLVDSTATEAVNVETLGGQILVQGTMASIRAVTLAGDATVDAPQGQVVEVQAQGEATLSGAASRELCVKAEGTVDVNLDAAERASLVGGEGDLTAAFVTPATLLEALTGAGDLRLEVPAGAYVVETSVSEDNTAYVSPAVTHDPDASQRIIAISTAGDVGIESP